MSAPALTAAEARLLLDNLNNLQAAATFTDDEYRCWARCKMKLVAISLIGRQHPERAA